MPSREEEAVRYIAEHITAPIFFQKLASYGFAPKSEEAAAALWKLGVSLLSHEETSTDQLLKQASEDIVALTNSVNPAATTEADLEKQAEHYITESERIARSPEWKAIAAILRDAESAS